MTKAFYEQVADALVGFLPPTLRDFHSAVSGRNVKIWYGDERHEHYEVQTIRSRGGGRIEIGYHAEHPSRERNEEALDRLMARERTWRRMLGRQPEGGAFVGNQPAWRRISELWDGPGLESEEAAIEAAERLARYIRAFRRARSAREP